ncbi:hypothetical protein JCM10296v2_004638 [Rhodotorula toruloides]
MTGFVQNYGGLVAARLILGMLEAEYVFPGLVLYLSSSYRRHELQTRIPLFFSAASLSGAFSGLLAAAIINLDGKGGQEGDGGFTALFDILLFFLLPGSPSGSRFLAAEQKAHIERRLKLDSPANTTDFEETSSWREFKKAATSPHVVFLLVALFGNGMTLYAFSYFTPTIVATFKYTTVRTQLLPVPPFACAFLTTMFTACWSDRYGRRGLCVILMCLLSLVGYIMFLKALSTAVRYVSVFLAITGVYSTAPGLVTWLPNNSAGH